MTKKVAEVSTETPTEEKSMDSWTPADKENSKRKYGCEILVENGTWNQVTGKDYPNDARIVTYDLEGDIRYDLTRGNKMSNIFDMYYDKFGQGVVKKIEFGYGRVSPKLWGYKSPEKKKKK